MTEADVQVFLRMRPFGEKEIADREKGYSFEVEDNVISENEAVTKGKLKFQYGMCFISMSIQCTLHNIQIFNNL